MRNFSKISLLALLAVIVLSWTAHSSRLSGLMKKNPNDYFLTEYAVFKDDSTGMLRLEIYYQIYNPALNFIMEDSLYVADYEIFVDVLKGNKQIGSYRQAKKVTFRDKKRVFSSYDYRTNQVSFVLEPGKYEVKITLSDPNSLLVLNKKFKVKLKEFKSKYPALSDIELIQLIAPTRNEPTVFDKGKMTMVPSVSHNYGSNNEDKLKLYFYFEIYEGKKDFEKIRIETVLRHFTKGMVYRDSLSSDFKDGVIRQFREISMEDLPAGEFELIVTIKAKRNKKLAVKYKDFTLFWTQKAMLKHDYKSVVNQIALIADKDEVKELKKHDTYEARLKAINDFWISKDPTPGTVDNESKDEFYKRVAIANKYFSYLNHKGWRTDRGRIFIVYGEPDQIDDYPIMPNNRPYQEWHYYRTSRYRKFVFVDSNEDGDYRLIYPYDGISGFSN
ncbi:GWxTD domain-containing protein [Candidatus Zixiibacteriota bacterium]